VSAQPRDWDAAVYDRVSTPQQEWAAEVLERLPLEGDEIVLDAGCGSGRVTLAIQQRLPRGRVIAVDGSPSMVEKAREALGPDGEVFVADLTALELDERVDVVFSNAVFHWIADHDALFARMFAALKPGGHMVVQCGGEGNLGAYHEQLHEICKEPPFAGYVGDWEGPWNFAGPDATAAKLEAAGFTDVRCWLEQRTVVPDEPDHFIRSVCLGHHLERLPEELREELVQRSLKRAGSPLTLPYVRLNIDARRPQ
jgi:trans-aconitate 2-methyltransferase